MKERVQLGKELKGHIEKFKVKDAHVTNDGQVRLKFGDYTIFIWVGGYTILSGDKDENNDDWGLPMKRVH